MIYVFKINFEELMEKFLVSLDLGMKYLIFGCSQRWSAPLQGAHRLCDRII